MMLADTLLAYIQNNRAKIDINNRDQIIKNLKFLHDICTASESMFCDAALESQKSGPQYLKEYYLKHYEEEKGELAILSADLASAGYTQWTKNIVALEMTGVQYYMIKHMHPICFLGYLAFTEMDHARIEDVEGLESLYGESWFKFLRLHAIKDQEHKIELAAIINITPPELEKFIWVSVSACIHYLRKAVEGFKYG